MRTLLISLTLLLSTTALAEKAGPIRDYPATQVAPNTYVIHGPLGIPSAANQGFMNNPAFVITPEGVVVIDPGSSVQTGEMVLRQIRQLTDKPVVMAINTHMHGDHWLGNHALEESHPGIKIYAHPKMHEAVSQGVGETWNERMLRLTDGATQGTQVVPPNQKISHSESFTLGGFTFRFIHTGTAHTNNDLMIEVVEEGVLFLGDNVLYQRLGQMNDGQFDGSIHAIDVALETEAKVFVPGHGRSGGREVPTAYRNYLTRLKRAVASFYDQDLTDYEMKPKVVRALAPFQGWHGFHDQIGRHISLIYLEVEAASF